METVTVSLEAYNKFLAAAQNLPAVMNRQYMDSGMRDDQIKAAMNALNAAVQEMQASRSALGV